jgi:hypothetical protein
MGLRGAGFWVLGNSKIGRQLLCVCVCVGVCVWACVFLKRNGSQGDHSTPIVGRTHNSQAGRQGPRPHFHGIGAVISPQRSVIRG